MVSKNSPERPNKDTKKDSSNKKDASETSDGCCSKCGVRLPTYLALFITVAALIALFLVNTLFPLSTSRQQETDLIEVRLLSFLNQLDEVLISKEQIIDGVIKSLNITELIETVSSRDTERVKNLFNFYFKVNGQWNEALFGSSIVIYRNDRTLSYGEYYDLNGTTYRLIRPAREKLPEQFEGETEASKRLLNRILTPGHVWKGYIDKNESTTERHYPISFGISVPVMYRDMTLGFIVMFVDERLMIGPIINELDVCVTDFPGNTVTNNTRPFPKDVVNGVKGLKGSKAGKFRRYNETGGTFKASFARRNKISRGDETICGTSSDALKGNGYVGTAYFSVHDEVSDNPEDVIAYLRMDVRPNTLEEFRLLINESSYVFDASLVVFAIIIVLFIEVGIMRRLDNAKKSLHQIIMERKAILEDYLNDERFTRDYYGTGDDKNSKSALEEVMDKAVRNAAGGGDNLALLLSMSKQLREWMEGVLNKKLRHLACLKEENAMFVEGMRMMEWWCGRNDVSYTISYLSMNKGMEKDEHEIEEFKKDLSLGHLMGNGIGFEFLKSFCKSIKQEKKIQFILDVGWLSMMEGIEEGGNAGGATTGVTHSQIVRLSQSIYGYYHLEQEKEGTSLGISSSTLKKLQGHVDGKGRVKYVKGMYKNAGSEVRKVIDNEIIPMFKESVLFRGMYMTLKYTSQIEGGVNGKKGGIKMYQMPIVRRMNDEDISGSKRHDDVIERVRMGVYEHDELDDILKEEKETPEHNGGISSSSEPNLNPVPKSGFKGKNTLGSSQYSLPSDTPSSNSRPTLPRVSPLSILLPKTHSRSSSQADSEDKGDSRKNSWTRSATLTHKNDKKE